MTTKIELKKQIQKILNKSKINRVLDAKEFELVYSVLKMHPNSKSKIGCGVKSIYIKKNYYKNNGFFIERIDGTKTDFSYLKCLNGDNKLNEIKAMFRTAIRPQIISFRNNAFKTKAYLKCPITGEYVSEHNCNIDHFIPSFFELFYVFINENNVDLNQIKVGGKEDGFQEYYFIDKTLERKWKKFHKKFANLRVLSVKGNAKRKRFS